VADHVASEVMAALALTSSLQDLRQRWPDGRGDHLRRQAGHGRRPEVRRLMAVLLRDAIKPNLLQTLEGGPAFVHCGPFANIATATTASWRPAGARDL